jgi:antitoxin PrlF
MPTATVTSKRQITIPAETCRELRIVPGTKIDFVKNSAGETVIRPKAGDIRSLRGIVRYAGPPVSVEDMKNAVGEAIAEDFRRSNP